MIKPISFPLPLPFRPPARPCLVGDGVEKQQEKSDGCSSKDLVIDQLERMARQNIMYVQGLKQLL